VNDVSISLKTMQYYCAALHYGSISQAAEASHVAASAIGAAIDQIEEHFQLTLTIRQRAKGNQPTADGRVMARQYQALLEDYGTVLGDGAEPRPSLSGGLRVGYYAPVAPAFLPRILTDLMGEDHALTLHLDACDNRAAQDGLRRGEYDVILFVSDEAEPWIAFAPLIEAPPYCLLASDHPLAGHASITLDELAGERLVSLNRPLVADYYRTLLNRTSQPVQTVAFCNSTEMVRSLVGAQRACAILNMLPLTETSYAGDRLVAVPIRDSLPSLTLSVGYQQGRQRRAVQAFVESCETYFKAPAAVVCTVP